MTRRGGGGTGRTRAALPAPRLASRAGPAQGEDGIERPRRPGTKRPHIAADGGTVRRRLARVRIGAVEHGRGGARPRGRV